MVWSLLGLPWNGLEWYASFGVFAVQASEMDRKHLVLHGQHFPSYLLTNNIPPQL